MEESEVQDPSLVIHETWPQKAKSKKQEAKPSHPCTWIFNLAHSLIPKHHPRSHSVLIFEPQLLS